MEDLTASTRIPWADFKILQAEPPDDVSEDNRPPIEITKTIDNPMMDLATKINALIISL